jgi:lipoate-protein ligase B
MAIFTKNQIQVTDLGVVDYESIWQMQKDFAELVISGEKSNTLFLLQHPSV